MKNIPNTSEEKKALFDGLKEAKMNQPTLMRMFSEGVTDHKARIQSRLETRTPQNNI